MYWRCSNRKCSATITTKDNLGCLNGIDHSCDLSNIEFKCSEVEKCIINRATNEENSLPKIYQEEQAKLIQDGYDYEGVAAFLNSNKTKILQKAYRARTALNPAKVKTKSDIDLDNEFGKTKDDKPFVIFDSNDSDRIIGFCSAIGLEILSKSKSFHVDGTFKSTPGVFYQTFGIHGWILNQMFPCVFALLGEKSERIYKKMLGLLKDACQRRGIFLNPDILASDFELASINAFKFHFPGIQIYGCQFHFAQAVRRKVDNLGLKIAFSANDDIQFFVKPFIALSMVPLDRLDEAFLVLLEKKDELIKNLDLNSNIPAEAINTQTGRGRGRGRGRSRGRGRGRGRASGAEENFEEINVQQTSNQALLIEEFVTYFVDTWFEGPFSVEFWNVSNTIGPRTNNHVEGFHNKLNSWLNKAHPDVYQLINIFKLIESGVSVDYTARLTGFSEPK
ncbi:unnamed protein product, partial [Brachionus calyciflorus]